MTEIEIRTKNHWAPLFFRDFFFPVGQSPGEISYLSWKARAPSLPSVAFPLHTVGRRVFSGRGLDTPNRTRQADFPGSGPQGPSEGDQVRGQNF